MAEMRVYKNDRFGGEFGTFNQDLPNVGEFWNDEITSVKVISGRWQVFEHTDFHGRSIILDPGDYPNLPLLLTQT